MIYDLVRNEMLFHVVYHVFVVSDTGVKGQCLYTFLPHAFSKNR